MIHGNLIRLFLGMSLLSTGCLDKIDFPSLQEEQRAIVVEGSLRLGNPSVANITISRLFDFSADGLKAVNLRSAILMDDLGNRRDLEEIRPGEYETKIFPGDTDFAVQIGRSYQMQIATFDGRTFISSPEPLLAVDQVGEVTVRPIQRETINHLEQFEFLDLFEFSVNAPVVIGPTGKANRYRYFLEQTYKLTDSPVPGFGVPEPPPPKTCFVTEITDVTSVLVFDGNRFGGTSEVKIPLLEALRNRSVFAEGYYLTVYQQSLSEGAFRYWNEISQVIERNGNMFEAPAGKIRSNFVPTEESPDGEVFGYFYATQEDTARLYVAPSMADNPANYCPGPPSPPAPGERCLPRFPCCDCLLADGSTLDQPSFWVE